ncbi:MAG TPA: PAS domain S-box protein [Xanthobacteraceae bacterium]|jgi:PAS domain S-box-containing protein|nr:PAS domain S-box protein [Xanthobacteraceae bacterium]
MVATRALLQVPQSSDTEAELRCCIRDLLSLSSLPALWVKADAGQIADSLAQLAVSILDAEFACVFLREPKMEILRCHERFLATPIDPLRLREKYRPNSKFEIVDDTYGRLRATCVPLGRDHGSALITLSRRPDFPSDTEQMLLRVAANQASIAIERWKSDARLADQTRALERLNETETALYTFTDQLFRAETPDEVYQAGLDAILRILRCERASILLFDDHKVMRFVAWRGLSDEYRRAVDGHSPWKPEDKGANPICVENIETAPDLSEELRTVVRAERIAALAFIPIFAGDTIVGKFMAYYDAPHVFAPREIEAGITIARQLGFGLERLHGDEVRRRLATIVETSDDAIISKNLDGVIQTWNRGAERIFGYTADEIIGKAVTTLMPLERYDEEPAILARLRRGERIDHYQTVRRRKDGTLLDVSLTVSPVTDPAGRIVAASKIARDITVQKRAETALRDNEQRLQDLLAAIPAAIYTTDAAGKITYYNEAAVEFAGRRPVIGSDEWCVSWKLYWPDGTPLPHDECPMALALKEGRPIRGKEAVAERPDGTRIPFIPFPTPIRDSNGKVIGGINMLVDVTERKQAETQQRMLMRELNHRVKNNMQMLQSVLFTATRRTQNQEARKVLEDASNRITAMAAAQRVLYDTSDATRFSASKFLDAVCGTAQQIFPSNIKIVCESGSGELDNDVAMPLALILNELLTNSVKYGCNGAGENLIRVGLTNGGGDFILYVEDDGPGFDLQSVIKTSSGLKLVQLLARQLRGQFEVVSKPSSRCSVRFS